MISLAGSSSPVGNDTTSIKKTTGSEDPVVFVFLKVLYWGNPASPVYTEVSALYNESNGAAVPLMRRRRRSRLPQKD